MTFPQYEAIARAFAEKVLLRRLYDYATEDDLRERQATGVSPQEAARELIPLHRQPLFYRVPTTYKPQQP